jgi:3-oxoacyl-[acyl-carrier protein] reductase
MKRSARPVALVSGGGTGIGAAAARSLAAAGCDIAINYLKSGEESLASAEACRAEGAKTAVVKGDVAIAADCRAIIEAAVQEFGHIDILVNNAGITRFADPSNLDALDRADFERIFSVNVIGCYQLTCAAVSPLRESTIASVVNVSSHSAFTGIGSSLAYAASKGALNTLTLGLARALAPEIRVNAVCPGFVNTRWMVPKLGEAGLASFRKAAVAIAPLKKLVEPEDVAEAISWFALGARAITGQLLVVDAGTHLTTASPRPGLNEEVGQ